MAEHTLPYTAEEIEDILRQVGVNEQAIEQVRKEIPKTAEAVGARPATWTPTASQVGADASGTAESEVASHNTSDASHNDIRLLIEGLTSKLNALANSDDTTLDQMAEVVAYIKNNKSLIDGITTNKVSVSDIIDNLTTSVSNKPLSAKQGVALKALIDAIIVPTKTSQLQNDSGFLTQHQDLGSYAKKSTTLSGYGITDGATKQEVSRLEETVNDLKSSGISADLKSALKTYFTNMQILFTQLAYTTESHIGATLVQNAKDIVNLLGSGTVEPETEVTVSQNGSTLVLSGVDTITTISLSGSTLALA